MYLARIGSGTALALSGTALVLLAVAPLGWRLGWWPYSFGLYWLMPASGYVGAVAVVLSVLTLALGWSELRPRGLGIWFRFTDDIAIRVSCDAAGSRIDVRSTSRQGRSDYGVNAARIRAYIGALRKRIG